MKGIYKILNTVNDKYYLGSSLNFHKRKVRHLYDLRNNKHHSILLQRAFNKYGEASFEFIFIKTCDNLLEEEQLFLDNLDIKKCYNISTNAHGGDLLKNRPDRLEIIAKRTASIRLSRPKKEKILKGKPNYTQEKNPNWKGGKTFCVCRNRINSNSSLCIKCIDRKGKNNSFFGKKHSQKTKDESRKRMLGVYNGNQEKSVLAEGKEYKSLSEAAKFYNVVPATILNRIKSKNYPDFIYK